MALIHARVPWTKLTRNGLPPFVVSRRPIRTATGELAVGSPVPHDTFVTRTRMRQMYEQRLIDPVTVEQKTGHTHKKAVKPTVGAQTVLSIEIPVSESSSAPSSPRVYQPSRKIRR